jgi:hypothetical protein
MTSYRTWLDEKKVPRGPWVITTFDRDPAPVDATPRKAEGFEVGQAPHPFHQDPTP